MALVSNLKCRWVNRGQPKVSCVDSRMKRIQQSIYISESDCQSKCDRIANCFAVGFVSKNQNCSLFVVTSGYQEPTQICDENYFLFFDLFRRRFLWKHTMLVLTCIFIMSFIRHRTMKITKYKVIQPRRNCSNHL